MENFTKIINPGKEHKWNIFCKIKYINKKLSITGVTGPFKNGDCAGSCGQIYDSINITTFTNGWNEEKLDKFINIWKEWHLNDMKPYSIEMKKAGWDKIAKKEIFKYELRRKDKYNEKLNKIKEIIFKNAINGNISNLTEKEKRLLQSEQFMEIYSYDENPKLPEFMELWIDYRTGGIKKEIKTLGWVTQKEHKDGLLGKKLNKNDKYGYGQKWFVHEIPEDVINFLKELPETKITPEWV